MDEGGQAVRCTCPGHAHTPADANAWMMVERALQGDGLELPDGRRLVTPRDLPAPDPTSVPSMEALCRRAGLMAERHEEPLGRETQPSPNRDGQGKAMDVHEACASNNLQLWQCGRKRLRSPWASQVECGVGVGLNGVA